METISAVIVGTTTLAALARIAFFRGPMATPVQAPPTGILDMHCHTAGIGEGGSGAWISEALRKSYKFPLYLKTYEMNLEKIRAGGDSVLTANIARRIRESKYVSDTVVLAMDCPYTDDGEMDLAAGEVVVPNRFVEREVRDYPELHFGASVHPARPDALQELQWSKDHGAVLVKWLPNIQNIDPSNERYTGYYNKLIELDLPLLSHTGAEDSFSKANDRLGDPRLLELPLKLGVRVIAAHVASSGESEGQCNVERLLEMMVEYPNLVADISTLTQFNRKKYLPKILNDPRIKGRLMYGTDYPLTNTPLVSPLLFPLELSLKQIWRLCRIKNSWDRDVQLKAALGVPREVFFMSRDYLGL